MTKSSDKFVKLRGGGGVFCTNISNKIMSLPLGGVGLAISLYKYRYIEEGWGRKMNKCRCSEVG